MKLMLNLTLTTLILSFMAASPALAADSSAIKKKKHKSQLQAHFDQALADDATPSAENQAQLELEETENFLKERDPTIAKRRPASLVKSQTASPQFLEKLGNVDSSEDAADREERSKSLGAALPTGQALSDYQNAQTTLKEVEVERKAKKAHIKTATELKEDRQEAAYRQAITKASKESANQKGKPQYVQTSKGKIKVVFINENEFADNTKAEPVSSRYSEAVKDVSRDPASVDAQIESIAQ